MRKDNQVIMRMSTDHKETMKAWAKRLGISVSQLYSMLAFQHGPKELLRFVVSEYGHKTLNRLGLPKNGLEVIQNDAAATNAFGYLLVASARAELSDQLGETEHAEFMHRHAENAEAELYRAFGEAVEKQESERVKDHHITDNF